MSSWRPRTLGKQKNLSSHIPPVAWEGGGGVQCLRPVVWGGGVHLLRGSPLQDPQTAAGWGRRSPDRSWRRSGRYRTWSPLWWSGRPPYCSRTLKGQRDGITHNLAASVTASVCSQESYSREQWVSIPSSSVLQAHKHCLATAERWLGKFVWSAPWKSANEDSERKYPPADWLKNTPNYTERKTERLGAWGDFFCLIFEIHTDSSGTLPHYPKLHLCPVLCASCRVVFATILQTPVCDAPPLPVMKMCRSFSSYSQLMKKFLQV